MATVDPVVTKLSSRNFTVTWSNFAETDTCTEFEIVDAEITSYHVIGVGDHINAALLCSNEPTFNIANAGVFDAPGNLAIGASGTTKPLVRFRWLLPQPRHGNLDDTGTATVIALFHGD